MGESKRLDLAHQFSQNSIFDRKAFEQRRKIACLRRGGLDTIFGDLYLCWERRHHDGIGRCDGAIATVWMARLFGIRDDVVSVHSNWNLLWICTKIQFRNGIFNGRPNDDGVSHCFVIDCKV